MTDTVADVVTGACRGRPVPVGLTATAFALRHPG